MCIRDRYKTTSSVINSGGHISSGHAINQQVSLRNLGKQTIHYEAHFMQFRHYRPVTLLVVTICITGRLDLYVYIYLCTIYKCHHHFMPYGIVLNLIVNRSFFFFFFKTCWKGTSCDKTSLAPSIEWRQQQQQSAQMYALIWWKNSAFESPENTAVCFAILIKSVT